MKITYAFCTYNRADRLEALVAAIRAQQCPVPFEILAVNNNSRDNTLDVLGRLGTLPGAPLRVVTETSQGIVPARNRAIEESLDSEVLVFLDDDEIPEPGTLAAAWDAISREGAHCAGGAVRVHFAPHHRPRWLGNELLGFLAEVNYGDKPLWLTDDSKRIWTGNIAYNMSLFREDPSLRFDARYNRVGADIGGGEDAAMFLTLIARGIRIRYRPDMVVQHFIEEWRLRRSYFLRLHYRAGLRYGEYGIERYPRNVLGVPPFMIRQFIAQTGKFFAMALRFHPEKLRQGMNVAHALGSLIGYRRRTEPAFVNGKSER